MGILDSLGTLFQSQSNAGSSGASWATLLGPLISQIRTTANPGATKGDMARAGRMNLFTGLLGGLASTYGAKQEADARTSAQQGLFDLLSKGGGTQEMEAAGPVMPGMKRPTVTSQVPLSQALYAHGRDNPMVRELSLKLGQTASENERTDALNQQKFNREDAWHTDEMGWKEKTFAQNAAHLRAMEGNAAGSLALQRQQAQWQHDNDVAALPYKQLANERAAYGDDVANELMRARMGAGGAPQAEVDDGKIGGFTPAVQPQATQQQVADPRLAAFDVVSQRKAAEKAATVGGQAFEKVVGSKEFQELNTSYNQIGVMSASLRDKSKVSDLAFANGWAKAMKPGEGVMADDIKTTLSASGVQTAGIARFMDVIMGVPGATLDLATKQKLLEVAAEAVRQREAGYQNIVGAYRGQYGDTFVDPWNRKKVDVLLQQALGGDSGPPMGSGGPGLLNGNAPMFTSDGGRITRHNR